MVSLIFDNYYNNNFLLKRYSRNPTLIYIVAHLDHSLQRWSQKNFMHEILEDSSHKTVINRISKTNSTLITLICLYTERIDSLKIQLSETIPIFIFQAYCGGPISGILSTSGNLESVTVFPLLDMEYDLSAVLRRIPLLS